MNFPTVIDVQEISENVSKNDGNAALYDEYIEDLQNLLVNMARTKSRDIYLNYREISGSPYGELQLLSRKGYLDVNYTAKVFDMLRENGYGSYLYKSPSIFSKNGKYKIYI